MNFEIWRAVKKQKNEEELYLLTATFMNDDGLVGNTWFLFPDEDTARGVVDAINNVYESTMDDFEVITDDGHKIVVSYGTDTRINLTFKIRKVK